MYNFVFNNLNFIKKFSKLYEKEIKVDAIFDFIKNESSDYNTVDFCRFRMFLDLCLLLLNLEQVNSIFKGHFVYKDYIHEYIKENNDLLMNLKNSSASLDKYKDIKLYYSLSEKELSEWDQICIIRNSLAHGQFGNFEAVKGLLTTFGVFNKDNGIVKNIGIVMEPLFHEVVKYFFSNYSYGLLHQYTVFSNYSIKNRANSYKLNYYKISLNDKGKAHLENHEKNVLLKLVEVRDKECLFDCIKDNMDYIDIYENSIENLINLDNFENMLSNLKYDNECHNVVFAIKTFLSTNEELSNFIAHVVHVVDIAYRYKIENKMNDNDLHYGLEPLCEDIHNKFSFDFGLVYLEIMNLIVRLQDNEYRAVNYNNIDVSCFKYDEENAKLYFRNIGEIYDVNRIAEYILKRLRNSAMHGNFKLSLTEEEYDIVFIDSYNNRQEEISISFTNLKKFVKQNEFYNSLQTYTNLIICSKDSI